MNTVRPGLMAPSSAPISFAAVVFTMAMLGPAAGGPALMPITERYYEAAVRGDPDAQASLAASYARGDGVPRSDAYTFQWLLRAAGQGHAKAQLMLSGLFANGKGIPQDYVTAYKWASLAAANSPDPDTLDNAVKMIRVIAAQLTEAEIAAARARAADWKPRKEVLQPDSERAPAPRLGGESGQRDRVAGLRSGGAASLEPQVRKARGAAYSPRAGGNRVKSCRSHLPARLLRLARRWGY